MANFVEIEYYDFEGNLQHRSINQERIFIISPPNEAPSFMQEWGMNSRVAFRSLEPGSLYELYFKTIEEAQATYNLLRGKTQQEGPCPIDSSPTHEQILKILTTIQNLLVLQNNSSFEIPKKRRVMDDKEKLNHIKTNEFKVKDDAS